MSKYFRGCLKRKGKVDIIHSTVIYQTYHCTALFSLITLYYSQQTSWLIITFVSLIKRPTHVDGPFARQIKKSSEVHSNSTKVKLCNSWLALCLAPLDIIQEYFNSLSFATKTQSRKMHWPMNWHYMQSCCMWRKFDKKSNYWWPLTWHVHIINVAWFMEFCLLAMSLNVSWSLL